MCEVVVLRAGFKVDGKGKQQASKVKPSQPRRGWPAIQLYVITVRPYTFHYVDRVIRVVPKVYAI